MGSAISAKKSNVIRGRQLANIMEDKLGKSKKTIEESSPDKREAKTPDDKEGTKSAFLGKSKKARAKSLDKMGDPNSVVETKKSRRRRFKSPMHWRKKAIDPPEVTEPVEIKMPILEPIIVPVAEPIVEPIVEPVVAPIVEPVVAPV